MHFVPFFGITKQFLMAPGCFLYKNYSFFVAFCVILFVKQNFCNNFAIQMPLL